MKLMYSKKKNAFRSRKVQNAFFYLKTKKERKKERKKEIQNKFDCQGSKKRLQTLTRGKMLLRVHQCQKSSFLVVPVQSVFVFLDLFCVVNYISDLFLKKKLCSCISLRAMDLALY